jgi:hypothetical protein
MPATYSALKWKFETTYVISASPTLSLNGSVVYVGADNMFYALDAATGGLVVGLVALWRSHTLFRRGLRYTCTHSCRASHWEPAVASFLSLSPTLYLLPHTPRPNHPPPPHTHILHPYLLSVRWLRCPPDRAQCRAVEVPGGCVAEGVLPLALHLHCEPSSPASTAHAPPPPRAHVVGPLGCRWATKCPPPLPLLPMATCTSAARTTGESRPCPLTGSSYPCPLDP